MGNIDNLPNFESLFSPADNKDKAVLKHDEGVGGSLSTMHLDAHFSAQD
jgi:hypothetical protein